MTSAQALYPNERATLRLFVTTDRPMTLAEARAWAATWDRGKPIARLAEAIAGLDSLGYLTVCEWSADARPLSWRASSFGRLALEELE